jgi:hypothetical protein
MARGEMAASSLLVKNAVPDSKTGTPGMNLSVSGLGVASVWINIIFTAFLFAIYYIAYIGFIERNSIVIAQFLTPTD